MRRPQLEFATLDSGRIVGRVGVIDVAEILPTGLGLVVNYIIRLPLPGANENRFRRANTLIEAKRTIWEVSSEWFIAAGVMDVDRRLRCDERLFEPRERRPRG
jgi:hypothetical protein